MSHKSKLTQEYEQELEKQYEAKLNSPLWLSFASKNIDRLKGYIDIIDEYGILTMRYNLALQCEIEHTPKEIECEYHLAKKTLALLEEGEDV